MASLARLRVDLLLLFVAAAWGSSYLVAKELVASSSVVSMLAVRMLLAAAVMAVIVGVRRKRLTRAEVRAGLGLGLLLSVVFIFETFGIAHTSATNAGLIISLTIVFTPILDSLMTGRRLPCRFFIAATIAIAGVVLLAGNGALQPPSLGDFLVLLAAIARAVHITSVHRLTHSRPMDSLHLTTVQLSICAVLFTMTSFVTGDPIAQYLATLRLDQALLFAYLILVCTIFAFLIQTWAVQRTSPSRVSLLLGTEPVWAALIGVIAARDGLGVGGYIGVGLILTGTAWGRAIEQRHRTQPHEAVVIRPPPPSPSGDAR